MFKKLILAAGLLAAGTFLLTGTRVGAYARAAFGWAKDAVVSNVPLEADIMAAQQLLADMDGKIESAVRTVARERAEIKKLEETFIARQESLKSKEAQLVELKKNLETNLTAYKPSELQFHQTRLVSLFNTYKNLEAQREVENKLLHTRRTALAASDLKVENLKTQKIELKARIEALDAKRKLLEAEKIVQTVEIDDSEIAGLKNLVSDIEKKLDVEVEVAKELESLKTGNQSAPAESAAEVMKKIDEKFGSGKTTTAGARI
jgi:hypothetical protein